MISTILKIKPFKGNLLTCQFMRDECTVHAQELFTASSNVVNLCRSFFHKLFSKCSKWPQRKPKLIVWTEKKHPKSSFKVYLIKVEIERAVGEGATRNDAMCSVSRHVFLNKNVLLVHPFVDVPEWIALDTVSKGERFTSASGLMATWWSGLKKLMKSVIAEDISFASTSQRY